MSSSCNDIMFMRGIESEIDALCSKDLEMYVQGSLQLSIVVVASVNGTKDLI